MAEPEPAVGREPLPLAVGTAPPHVVADRAQLAGIDAPGGVPVGKDAGDAAHGLEPIPVRCIDGSIQRRCVAVSVSKLLDTAMQWVPRSFKDRVKRRFSVPDMEWSLRNLAKLGFDPARTLDVGAYEGHWAELCKAIFPRTQIAMIEAQPQKRAALERVAARFPGEVQPLITLVGAEHRTDVTYYENETVTSVLAEVEVTAARRRVGQTLLDRSARVPPP